VFLAMLDSPVGSMPRALAVVAIFGVFATSYTIHLANAVPEAEPSCDAVPGVEGCPNPDAYTKHTLSHAATSRISQSSEASGQVSASTATTTTKVSLEPEKQDSGEYSSAEGDLVEGVAEIFADLSKLLQEQTEAMVQLQEMVTKQAHKLDSLKRIAAKGFQAFQDSGREVPHADFTFGFKSSQGGGGASSYRGGGGVGGNNGFYPSMMHANINPEAATGLVSNAMGMDKTIAKYKVGFFDHLRLMSAVKVDTETSAVMLMPQDGGMGTSRYLALGDNEGKVYIFRPQGELMIEFPSGSYSPVTALSAYVVRRNETVLLVGHEDGSAHFHRIEEHVQMESLMPEDMYTLMQTHVATVSLVKHAPASGGRESQELVGVDDDTGAVVFMEAYRWSQRRFVVLTNAQNELTVYKENGTLHGTAQSPSSIVQLKSGSAMTIFITENGVGSLDLNTMVVEANECQGLNGSTIVTAAFDSFVSSRAYALTTEGELLTLTLVGDRRTDCFIKTRKSAGLMPPASLASLKGYLIASTSTELWVFNVTGNSRSGPRFVLQDSLDNVAAAFGHNPSECPLLIPKVLANRHRQVVASFCNGLIGAFESHLPVQRPQDWNPKLWSQPLFIGAIVVVAMYQFYNQRRRTSFGGDTGGMGSMGGFGGGRGRGGESAADIISKLQASGLGKDFGKEGGYGNGGRNRNVRF